MFIVNKKHKLDSFVSAKYNLSRTILKSSIFETCGIFAAKYSYTFRSNMFFFGNYEKRASLF